MIHLAPKKPDHSSNKPLLGIQTVYKYSNETLECLNSSFISGSFVDDKKLQIRQSKRTALMNQDLAKRLAAILQHQIHAAM